MESLSKFLLTSHIIAGSISLIIFWLPIFTKKGGNWHRKIGMLYVYLMWYVVLTAFVLSIENFFQGAYVIAAFLGFLTLATGQPLWSAISILKNKKGLSPTYRKIDIVFNATIFLSAIGLLIWGLMLWGTQASVLMIFFSFLGLGNGKDLLKNFRQSEEKDWLKEHYSGMIVSAIAGYTAFFAFGGRHYFSHVLTDYWQIVPWIAPTIVGVAIIKYMGYKRR